MAPFRNIELLQPEPAKSKNYAASQLFSCMKRFLGFLCVISLASNAIAQERKYGTLRLDFKYARKNDFAVVIPAKNNKDQRIFIGVYCQDRLFNFTGSEGQWKEWQIPVNIYESRIVADVCNQI